MKHNEYKYESFSELGMTKIFLTGMVQYLKINHKAGFFFSHNGFCTK